MSDELKSELRYYLRVAVTIALAIVAARYGIKIEPPPVVVVEGGAKVTVVSPK